MPKHSWKFEALGTAWDIATERSLSVVVKQKIKDTIEEFDATFSRFRSDTKIAGLRRPGQAVTVSKQYVALLELYESLGELTSWKFSPLVGEILEAAGYGPGYSLQPEATIDRVPGYAAAIKRDGATLTAKMPVVFDVGAAGKGFLVDLVSDVLTNEGYADFVVDASGDMRLKGHRIERVGLENPFDATQVIGTIEINNTSLAASAINRRAWGEWHHVIDPTTARPAGSVVATWVVAETTMIADALATALFFVSAKQLQPGYNYEYLRIYADGSMEYSEYFAKGIFA